MSSGDDDDTSTYDYYVLSDVEMASEHDVV